MTLVEAFWQDLLLGDRRRDSTLESGVVIRIGSGRGRGHIYLYVVFFVFLAHCWRFKKGE